MEDTISNTENKDWQFYIGNNSIRAVHIVWYQNGKTKNVNNAIAYASYSTFFMRFNFVIASNQGKKNLFREKRMSIAPSVVGA